MKITLDNAPLGSIAPAINGGHWEKTERGWKWSSGATFPRPGGDWNGEIRIPANPLKDCPPISMLPPEKEATND